MSDEAEKLYRAMQSAKHDPSREVKGEVSAITSEFSYNQWRALLLATSTIQSLGPFAFDNVEEMSVAFYSEDYS
jgi:hypothetical protein